MNMNSNIKEFVYVLLFIFTTILVNYTGLTYMSTFHRLTIRILSLPSIQSTGRVHGEQLFFCELTRNCAVIIEVKKKAMKFLLRKQFHFLCHVNLLVSLSFCCHEHKNCKKRRWKLVWPSNKVRMTSFIQGTAIGRHFQNKM